MATRSPSDRDHADADDHSPEPMDARRAIHALGSPMCVTTVADDLHRVRTATGSDHTVDGREKACQCESSLYRGRCRHLDRVRLREAGVRGIELREADL
jgi:hypothetical protein